MLFGRWDSLMVEITLTQGVSVAGFIIYYICEQIQKFDGFRFSPHQLWIQQDSCEETGATPTCAPLGGNY